MKLNITALATMLTPFKDQLEARFGSVREVLFYGSDQCQLIWHQYDIYEEGSDIRSYSHWLVMEYKPRYSNGELHLSIVHIQDKERCTLYNSHQRDPEDVLDIWQQLVKASETLDEEFFNSRFDELAKQAYKRYVAKCRA